MIVSIDAKLVEKCESTNRLTLFNSFNENFLSMTLVICCNKLMPSFCLPLQTLFISDAPVSADEVPAPAGDVVPLQSRVRVTDCPSSHERKALCCKMAWELDAFLEANSKWVHPFNLTASYSIISMSFLYLCFGCNYVLFVRSAPLRRPLGLNNN